MQLKLFKNSLLRAYCELISLVISTNSLYETYFKLKMAIYNRNWWAVIEKTLQN